MMEIQVCTTQHNNQPILWSGVLLEKLIVAQRVKKILTFHVTVTFIIKSPPLDSVLSQMNSHHILATNFLR